MPSPLPKVYKVLITDDSDDDRFFLRRILEQYPRFAIIGEACDGKEAISYLSGDGEFSTREKHPMPDLMLLDLKMPRTNGFDVLQWLQTRWYPRLTVIVLSSSNLAEDVGASLALGAKGYWVKTGDQKKQNETIREIETLLDTQWKQWCAKSPYESSKIRFRSKPKTDALRHFSITALLQKKLN